MLCCARETSLLCLILVPCALLCCCTWVLLTVRDQVAGASAAAGVAAAGGGSLCATLAILSYCTCCTNFSCNQPANSPVRNIAQCTARWRQITNPCSSRALGLGNIRLSLFTASRWSGALPYVRQGGSTFASFFSSQTPQPWALITPHCGYPGGALTSSGLLVAPPRCTTPQGSWRPRPGSWGLQQQRA